MGEEEREALLDELKLSYIRQFDTDSAELQQTLNLTFKVSRLLLATVLYSVTYDKAQLRNGRYSLSFCWEVCATELHHIKKQRMLHREHQSPLADVLNSQKPYL